jgi:hypothetical protein
VEDPGVVVNPVQGVGKIPSPRFPPPAPESHGTKKLHDFRKLADIPIKYLIMPMEESPMTAGASTA